MKDVTYREPRVSDAQSMLNLVRSTPALDENSWYYYALFSEHFSDTSLVADVDGQFAAFVTGYRMPQDNETLFLWQTASVLDHGVQNLGLNLLVELVRRCSERAAIKYVAATTDPSNRAIDMQFRLLARALKASSEKSMMFKAADVPELEHDEQLVRIGPL